ncbi:MAG: hypothetical protein WCP30_09720 [Mycobacteriaceae bacterium]
MTEHLESADWDETVDVLCVGEGPGALAYGIFCDASDLDVLIVECAELDPQTRDWRRAMTEDLDGGPPDARLPLISAEPVPVQPINDRTRLEPFVGEHLRQWSAGCLASPFGVMFSHVPDLDPMRTAEGQSVTAGVVGSFQCDGGPPGPALVRWLRERAEGLFGPADDRLDGLIIEDGRIAGVVLHTADGPCRVGATHGLVLSLGGAPECWPDQPELAGLEVDVAVVGRRAGRFARVQLLASQ